MKKVAKRSLYVQGDRQTSDVVCVVGRCEIALRRQSTRLRHYATKRTNEQNKPYREHPDDRNPAPEERSEIALSRYAYESNVLGSYRLPRREKDEDGPPSIDALRTMDSSFDKRFRDSVKRVLQMKKYRERYKELLV